MMIDVPPWFAALSQEASSFAALGAQLARAGKLEEAAVAFARALALSSGDPRLHAAQGSVMQRLRRNAEAREHYRRAIALGFDDAQVWTNLGEVELDGFAFDTALDAFRRAIALDPEGRTAAGARARALVLKVARAAT